MYVYMLVGMARLACVDPLPTHMAMAARSFLLRPSRSLLLRQTGVMADLHISRSKSHSRSAEEVKAYANFRREISQSRKKFQDEWRTQQQMKMEGFNAQAAKEARLEREREERALEENQIELERMRTERYVLYYIHD